MAHLKDNKIVVLAILVVATVVLVRGVNSQVFQEPSSGFPNGNIGHPINVGPTAQVKEGPLTLENILDLSGTRAVNLKDPINPQDGVTKAYIDSLGAISAQGTPLARGDVYTIVNPEIEPTMLNSSAFITDSRNGFYNIELKVNGSYYDANVQYIDSNLQPQWDITMPSLVGVGSNGCMPSGTRHAGYSMFLDGDDNLYMQCPSQNTTPYTPNFWTREGPSLAKITTTGVVTQYHPVDMGMRNINESSVSPIRRYFIGVDGSGTIYSILNDVPGSRYVVEKWDNNGNLLPEEYDLTVASVGSVAMGARAIVRLDGSMLIQGDTNLIYIDPAGTISGISIPSTAIGIAFNAAGTKAIYVDKYVFNPDCGGSCSADYFKIDYVTVDLPSGTPTVVRSEEYCDGSSYCSSSVFADDLGYPEYIGELLNDLPILQGFRVDSKDELILVHTKKTYNVLGYYLQKVDMNSGVEIWNWGKNRDIQPPAEAFFDIQFRSDDTPITLGGEGYGGCVGGQGGYCWTSGYLTDIFLHFP